MSHPGSRRRRVGALPPPLDLVPGPPDSTTEGTCTDGSIDPRELLHLAHVDDEHTPGADPVGEVRGGDDGHLPGETDLDGTRDRRRVTAQVAVGTGPHGHLVPRAGQGVVEHDPADRGLPGPGDEFDRLGRLQGAHDPGQDPEHPGLGARGHRPGRWRRREDTPIARTPSGPPHTELTGEGVDGGPDVRDAREGARIGHEIPRGEVVGTVDDEIVCADELLGGGTREPLPVDPDGDVRVDATHPVRGRLRLVPAEIGLAVHRLAVQVGHLDDVVVDDPDGADAGCCEIGERGRAEPARPDDENPAASRRWPTPRSR